MAHPIAALSVLLVEDNPDDAELILHELRRSGFSLQARQVQTEPEYASALAAGPASGRGWDVILADSALPEFSGQRALQWLRARGSDVPFIVVSGAIGEETGVQFMREGASDYLLKSQLVRLAPAVQRALEQRRLRQEQQRSEENYRRLFEDAMVGIYQTTPDGRYLSANPAVARILGYDSPAELMASVTDVSRQVYVDPGNRAELLHLLEVHGAITGFEAEFRRKDGRTIWGSTNIRAVRAEDGTLLYYEGILEDITARKLSEASLRASEERFAKAFRASPVALTMTRLADGRFVDVNNRFLELLGFQRDEVIGQTTIGLGVFPDLGKRSATMRRFQAEGSLLGQEMTLLTKSGEPRHFVFSTEKIELEGEAHALSIFFDNTEQKRAEAALQRLNAELEARVAQRTAELAASETKFRTLFDVLPVGVSIVDDQRRVVEANPALARILKMSSTDLAANPYGRQFIHPDGTPLEPDEFPTARVLQEQRPIFHMEVGVITETGETLWTDVSAAPLPVPGFSAVMATADLTERKRIEAALRQSEEKFARAFHAVSAGIFIVGSDDGRILEVNDSFLRLIGFGRDEVIGRMIVDLGVITAADRQQTGDIVRQHGRLPETEIRLTTKSGENRSVLTSAESIVIGGRPCILSINQDITERQRVAASLRQSEERFAKAFRSSPAGLTITRAADSAFVDVNDTFMSLMGYRRDEVIGYAATELNAITDLEERAELVRRFAEQGAVHNFEVVRRTKSGQLRNMLLSADTLSLDGEAHILTTMLDITDRKQAEAALSAANAALSSKLAELEQRTAELAASETKFRTLFDVLPVGVSILDDQRRVVDANRALPEILKISSADLAANPYAGRAIRHPDGRPLRPEEFPSARVLQERRPVLHVEMNIITETGETLALDVSAAPLPVAGFSAVVTTADLTERKRIEAALRQSEEKFSKAFHASGAGIVISRQADGRILECNDSYLRLLGYERQEVIGRTTLEIRAITAEVRERLVAATRQHGRVSDMEIGVLNKAGAARTVVTSTESIEIEGQPCLLSILYDVTERKQTEQALAQERDLLQALLDNIPDTIYYKDRASRFTRVNRAQARMLGVAAPELAIGKTDADFLASPLAAEFFAEEQRLLDSGQPIVDRLEFNPTPSGQPRWLTATKVPLKDAAGQVIGLVGISRDVTTRVKAEEDLQRLNQALAARVHELSVLNMLEEQLQSCQTVEDTLPVVAQLVQQLFPALPGALYFVQGGRSRVTTAVTWGAPVIESQEFEREACLALRQGQIHVRDSAHPDEACPHLPDDAAALCVPLLAHEEAQGLLHLRAPQARGPHTIDEATQQLARVVADNVALTWANLTLRESLRQQAIRDPLTHLFNRRFMEELLQRELRRAARLQQDVSLMMMDIDHFKQINDQFGHETGDAVLRALGGLLLANLRGSDIACRYGGEEFLLILPNATLETARQRAEQLLAKFHALRFGTPNDEFVSVTLSLGIAAFPQHGESFEAVLRAADAALYQAKHAGRNRALVAPMS